MTSFQYLSFLYLTIQYLSFQYLTIQYLSFHYLSFQYRYTNCMGQRLRFHNSMNNVWMYNVCNYECIYITKDTCVLLCIIPLINISFNACGFHLSPLKNIMCIYIKILFIHLCLLHYKA